MPRKISTPLDFTATMNEAASGGAGETLQAVTVDHDLDIAPRPEMAQEPEATPMVRQDEASPARTERRSLTEARPRLAPPAPVKSGGWIYVVALAASALWGAAPVAYFAAKDAPPFNTEPFSVVVLAILILGPIALFWVLAFVLNQGGRLAAEARFARAQAEDMIHPAAIAAAGAGGAVEMIRDQIEQAVAAASQARHELITLREVLASETAHLAQATASSAEAAARITQSVGDERRELAALTEVLKAQTDEVEDSINRQSAMVAQAADLADAKIREAEARLTASAADLATASGEASSAARTAGEDLSRQAARLEAAGTVVVEQVRTVEDSLAEQRAALVTVAHELRADQEDFGAEVESRQAQLSAILANVRTAASDIGQSAEQSGQALQTIVENAADRFRDLGEAAAAERDHFSGEVLKSVGAISEAARNEREMLVEEASATMEALSHAAADATTAVATQTEAARAKVDQLSEAAFAAGQQAEFAFQARLNEARELIDRSAALVEEAGGKAGDRLAEGLKAAHQTVERLEGLLNDVDARVARMPAEAEERQAEVRAVVEKGVEDLLGAARRAADETQAIDAAFQERVRRNYEMLSEAVRLMGVVGGSGSPRPSRFARPTTLAAPAETPSAPAAERPPQPTAVDDANPLRPRLKLTPEAIDEEVFTPGAPANFRTETVESEESKELTWKEILSSVEDEPQAPASPSGSSIIEEIRQLGIDPMALLPRSRLDDIAMVLQAGDRNGAREVVHQLAPAAMRRLSRRILSDDALRGGVDSFIRSFEDRLQEAAARDPEGFAIGELLGGDEGRGFLLVDAAVAQV